MPLFRELDNWFLVFWWKFPWLLYRCLEKAAGPCAGSCKAVAHSFAICCTGAWYNLRLKGKQKKSSEVRAALKINILDCCGIVDIYILIMAFVLMLTEFNSSFCISSQIYGKYAFLIFFFPFICKNCCAEKQKDSHHVFEFIRVHFCICTFG